MKKILLALLVSTSAFAQTITPEFILDKYTEAIGGKAKIESIKDISFEAETDAMGQIIDMNVIKKLPGKVYMTQYLSGMEMGKIILNNDKLKISQMGNDLEITPAMLETYQKQASIFPEIDYIKNGFKLSVGINEKVNDEDCYVLNIEGENPIKEYYSVKTGLRLRQDVETAEMSISTFFNNYKSFEPGILIPTQLRQEVMGQAITTEYKTLKLNSNVEDSVFDLK